MNARTAAAKRLARLLLCLCLALAANPLAARPRVVEAAGPYVVDTLTDGPDSLLSDSICSDGVDGCSLRAAIQQATYDGVPTTISFSNGLAGSTFFLDDLYGEIDWIGSFITVTGGANNITLSGLNLASGNGVFLIEGDDNVLEDLTVLDAPQDGVAVGDFAGTGSGNRNRISEVTLIGNGASGVYVHGGSNAGGTNNVIIHSRIGTIGTGPCAGGWGNNWGIYVDAGADGTLIEGNTIGCNDNYGVELSGPINVELSANSIGTDSAIALPNQAGGILASATLSASIHNNNVSGNFGTGLHFDNSAYARVANNLFGVTGPTGAMSNSGHGLSLTDGSHDNTIGGVFAGDRNIISSNGLNGVLIDGAATHHNWVAGNYIGTDILGAASLGNSQYGVAITGGAHDNLIGGPSAGTRNVISGNGGAGVYIGGSTANTVNYNFIGLNAAGTQALPNGQDGIWIDTGSASNVIGDPGAPNQYVAGNVGTGILILGASFNEINHSTVAGITPGGAPLGNGDGGVFILNATDNYVVPEIVAYNTGAGIAVAGATSLRNHLYPDSVYANTGLPIDLGADGPTANDAGDGDSGPNALLNYPVITASSGNVITGTVCANCYVFVYRAINNPAANGGGAQFQQFVHANGSGAWQATLLLGQTRFNITLQAQVVPGSAGDSSEFSPRARLFLPLVLR